MACFAPARLSAGIAVAAAALGLVAAAPRPAQAASTVVWEVRTTKEFSEGKLDGAIVTSADDVRMGWTKERHEVAADAVWCVLAEGKGRALIGTGSKGEIFRLADGKVERVAETGQVAVTVLRRAKDGGVLVGTMPEGRIYRLGADDKLAELVQLPAKYVWDLAVAPDGAVYAATGPEGQLFRIVGGNAEVWFKSKEQNLLSLAIGWTGEVYAGSGEKGLLFRVGAKDSARVVYDFEENEVRAMVVREDGVLVAANAAKSKGGKKTAAPGDDKAAAEKKEDAAAVQSKEPMDCAVYRLANDGSIEAAFASKGEFIWSLIGLADGSFVVATGENGRVYRAKLPGASPKPVVEDGGADVLFDLEEGQALALGEEFGAVVLVGTGSGAAVYTIDARAPGKGEYVSKVLDTKFVSTWGRVEWDCAGDVLVETRSGATAEPDETWEDWRPLERGTQRARSSRARYFQFRASLKAPDAALRAARVAYCVDNQRPRISSVEVADAGGDKKPDVAGAPGAVAPPSHVTMKTVSWKAADPDGDRLVARLYYRPADEPGGAFRAITARDPVTGDKYSWETRGLPDGRYVVRVVASDETANAEGGARSAARDSSPVLVDHLPPDVVGLKVAGAEVTGRARDAFSRVAFLAYAIDGGDLKLVDPEDGLLDSLDEGFRFRLPAGIEPGIHTLVVHAADEAGNLASARLTFRSARP